MADLAFSTRKELDKVEKELQETQTQIELLLNRQSALQEKRAFLKKNLRSLSEQQKASHDWSSESFDWSDELRAKCNSVFRIKSFRSNQLETINTTMSGLDCILVMPTGAGKSLCYQLPATISSGLTLVICPLVSLMEDQVMSLQKREVSAVMLTASSSKETVNTTYADMTRKPCRIQLLYVTPEKLAKSKRFMNKLEQCNKAGLLSRIAIDEVHCCSHWGHDFRPDYKFLGILKKQFPKVPILGLTATASAGVLIDVQKILHLPHAQVFKGSFNRKNLYYSVEPKPANHSDCMDRLSHLLQSKFAGQSGIIYCFSRKDTVNVADELKSRGIKSASYHADLDPRDRSKTHSLWLNGNVQVIVATIAFGMGIDKPNVRFVIHHSLSKSMENYYQESGRAGRDDLPAECILMYRLADVYRQSCMVFAESTGLEKLYGMAKYCIDQSTCRRMLIAEHFSEVWSEADCHGQCDHCAGVVGNPAVTSTNANKAIQIVYEILDKAAKKDSRLTGQKLLEAMTGKGNTQHRARQSCELTKDGCEYLLANMLTSGLIREDFHFTPYSTISYVVIGNRQEQLTLPSVGKSPSDEVVEMNETPKLTKRKETATSSSSKAKKKRPTESKCSSPSKAKDSKVLHDDVIVLSD